MMTLTTGRSVHIGLAMALGVLALNAAVSWRSIRQIAEIERWVSHTQEALAAISETISTLEDAEVEQRNYIVTGDPQFLRLYEVDAASLRDRTDRVEALTTDNPAQQALIAAGRSQIERWLAALAECTRVRREGGLAAAVEFARSGAGRREMDALRAVFADMEAEEEKLLWARSASSRHAYSMALVTTFVSAAASLALIALIYTIAGRIIAMQARAEALEEVDRRKDDFLAVLAHELRNPLAAIRAALDSIRLVGRDALVAGRPIATIEHQSEHLTRLIEDLLDASRISQGKFRLRREPIRLADAVGLAVEISQPLRDARGQRLSVEIPSCLTLDGDPNRLAQVFANLLGNASKYSGRGSRIWLTAAREGDRAVVRVRDEGRGIAPEMMPRLFGLFAQEERVREDAQGGLGIGLSLVKRLVEMHGGAVEAHSEGPGRGSEFTVRLPLMDDEPAPAGVEGPAGAPEAPHEGPCRILLADDNVEFTDLYATMLGMNGHEVEVIHDGTAAVEAARQFRPDVVLSDIGLPGLDGFEVAERLREQPETSGALLVALSGSTREEDRARALDVGFDRYLIKPVRFAEIEEVLALGHHAHPASGHAGHLPG